MAEENIMRCDCKENGNDCKEKSRVSRLSNFCKIYFLDGVFI